MTRLEAPSLLIFVSSPAFCAALCNPDVTCQSFAHTQPATCQKLNPFLLTNTGLSPATSVYIKIPDQPSVGNILVVGGKSTSGVSYADAEIINPTKANSSCVKPPNYPLSLFGAAGGLLAGLFVSCGGYTSTDVNNCYMHNPTSNSWQAVTSLPQASRLAKATVFGDTLLVTGGGTSGGMLAAIQALRVGEGYVSFASMPFSLCRHCIASINRTHAVILGGTRVGSPNPTVDVQNALILNVPGQQYVQMASFDQFRLDPFCGVIMRPSGVAEVVLTGGSSDTAGNSPRASTTIYSIASNSWRAGPSLPSAMCAGGSVQYAGNTFLVVHPNGLYQYDVVNDGWISLPGTMKTARRWFAYALVPPDYVQCN